ncbi:uncharacterized protein LOC118182500 isoform X2 [Stegodyphus dumicola]|uniref:uncharacterized protein LOC118182500 isoform X2 n=1 Tax=Stegodyphus dumicola TaxID=202533 RepID=UPI0015B2CCD1|nr:uncharacterized protein LOC118182500 isoform X2 [Stegodyphus dumicola]
MYRTYYYVEILLLLFLYYAGWNSPSKSVFNCSRTKSKLVRLIIQKAFLNNQNMNQNIERNEWKRRLTKKIIPILLRYKLSLPLSCPFHNERDFLWWPDVRVDFQDEEWICPFCGQTFLSESIISDHWDKNHAHDQKEDATCFANFCDIFRCEVILAAIETEKLKLSSDSLPSLHYHQSKTLCNDKKMFQLQKKCKFVMRQCLLGLLPSILDKEFQDIEEVNQAICSYLSCHKYLDGSLQVVQPVPVLVCVIVGSVLLGGFCLCYYVVYNLSSPIYSNNNDSLCNGAAQPRYDVNFRKYDRYPYRENKNSYLQFKR